MVIALKPQVASGLAVAPDPQSVQLDWISVLDGDVVSVHGRPQSKAVSPATLLTANATIRTATRGVIIVKVIVEWLWETRKWLFARVAVQIGS